MFLIEKMRSEEASFIVVLAAVFFIGALYLWGGEVWDDRSLLEALERTDLFALWSHPVGGGAVGQGYYRPFSMMILKILSDVTLIHIVALAVHLATVWGVFKVTERNWASALFYGVHPLNSEILGWASALPDILCICLVIWTIQALREERFGISAILFFIALCSKESAVLILLCAAVINKRALVSMTSVLALYLGLRMIVPGMPVTPDNWNAYELIQALLWSYGSLILPFPLTAVREVYAAPVWMLVLGLSALIAAVWMARGRGHEEKIGLILLIGGPLVALPTIASSHMAAERYLSISVLGAALLFTSLRMDLVRAWRMVVLMIIAVVPLHVSRALAWQSNMSLFLAATEVLPASTYSWYLLGRTQLFEERYNEASISFQKSLQLPHSYPDADLQLLKSLVLDGQNEAALKMAESGPKEGLTADRIAWWGRAAAGAGADQKAADLFELLHKNHEYDGPAWVEEWAKKLNSAERNSFE